MDKKKLTNLEQLLDLIEEASKERDDISFGIILDSIGSRSFGPLLLFAGVMTVIGDIPGMAMVTSFIVLLTSGQLVLGKKHFWFPYLIRKQSISHQTLCKILKALRPAARFIDRWIKPRLQIFMGRAGIYLIAITSTAIALVTPLLQVIPFTTNITGLAITAFGLGMISHDGLWVLFALILTAGTFGLMIYSFFNL